MFFFSWQKKFFSPKKRRVDHNDNYLHNKLGKHDSHENRRKAYNIQFYNNYVHEYMIFLMVIVGMIVTLSIDLDNSYGFQECRNKQGKITGLLPVREKDPDDKAFGSVLSPRKKRMLLEREKKIVRQGRNQKYFQN